MMKSMIRNVSQSPITLPPPYIGILPPGAAVVVDDPPSVVVPQLYRVAGTESLLTVDEVNPANQTTLPVSKEAAADTIATVTFASLTSPLDFNGQRAINAADPIASQDLVTLSYFNTHGSGGGGIPYADLGEVDAPGGPYPAIPAGYPVAVVGGVLVQADASLPANTPVKGLYTGEDTNRVRTSGLLEGLTGLPSNSRLYLAVGGGLTSTPPAGAGQVSQAVGTSVGTTSVFVAVEDPVYL